MKRTLTSLAVFILIASVFWAFTAPPPYTRTHESDAEISNLVASLNISGSMMAEQGIVEVRQDGNDATATNATGLTGTPWQYPTNAWDYLAGRGSNNIILDIGPGIYHVRGDYDTAAPFYTAAALTNWTVRGAGKYATTFTNSNWGDIFQFAYPSGFEIRDLGFHQRIGLRSSYTDPTINSGENVTCLRIFGGTNIVIRNIYGLNIYDIFIWGEQCHYVSCSGIEVDNLGTTNLFVNSQQGDGAGISGTGDHWKIYDCKFRNTFYAVEIGGHDANRTNVDWVVDNVSATSWYIPFAVFPTLNTFWRDVTFKNCYASGVLGKTNQTQEWHYNQPCKAGFKSGNCDNLTIQNCNINNCIGGIWLTPSGGNAYNFALIDNTISWTDPTVGNAAPTIPHYGISIIAGSPDSAAGNNSRWYNGIIRGNRISELSQWGIMPMGSNILCTGNILNNVGWALHPEGSAFKFTDYTAEGDMHANFNKGIGKIYITDNMISVDKGTSVTAAISFFGSGTNVTWMNNRIIGGIPTINLRSFTGYFVTNTTWNAMWPGPAETNFVTF